MSREAASLVSVTPTGFNSYISGWESLAQGCRYSRTLIFSEEPLAYSCGISYPKIKSSLLLTSNTALATAVTPSFYHFKRPPHCPNEKIAGYATG
jgi:hypothetical protein